MKKVTYSLILAGLLLAVVLTVPAFAGEVTVVSNATMSGAGAMWGTAFTRANEVQIEELNKEGGLFVGGERYSIKYVKYDNKIQILTVFETPIQDVWARCNKDSLGLAAECLIKTISAKNTQGDINGEWPHGQSLVSRYLNSLNIPFQQFVLDDGSGLSRKNRLSPNTLVAVLKDIYASDNRDLFFDSLAVGGVDGTISKYFCQTPYKNNILGKTGYISSVRSFSGICKTPRGDILFSILTEGGNGYTRRCINEITEAIYNGTY